MGRNIISPPISVFFAFLEFSFLSIDLCFSLVSYSFWLKNFLQVFEACIWYWLILSDFICLRNCFTIPFFFFSCSALKITPLSPKVIFVGKIMHNMYALYLFSSPYLDFQQFDYDVFRWFLKIYIFRDGIQVLHIHTHTHTLQ